MNKLQEWCQNNNATDVLSEWDFEKNTLPQNVASPRSTKTVWWKCERGHSYEAPINDKIRKRYEASCFQCKYDMWSYEKNKCSKEEIKTNPGIYWWKCNNKDHAAFLAHSYDIVCPSCKRDNKISEYEADFSGIYDRFELTPFEEYLYKQLSHYDLSTFNPESKIFNISNIRRNEELNKKRIKHFDIDFKDTGFSKISKENYIDFSIFDDICCRQLPFDFRIKAITYNNIIYDLLIEKINKEQLCGVVDLADEFKKALFLYSLEHSWYTYGFFMLNHFIYEDNRIELIEKTKNDIEYYSNPSDNEIITALNNHLIIEKARILEECLDDDTWNRNQSLFQTIKEEILRAKTLEDKIKVGEQFVNNPIAPRLFNISIQKTKTGVDFVLGNFPKDEIEKRISNAYKNYDYNMEQMNKDNKEDFNAFLNQYVTDLEMEEIYSLKNCKASGIYLLVLDDYKRVYIGQAENIYRRIKQHWSHSTAKPLGRLIWGGSKSVISIDCFGPLDTTRIFVKYLDKNELNKYEQKMVSEYERHYLLNRIGGGGIIGVLNYIDNNEQ